MNNIQELYISMYKANCVSIYIIILNHVDVITLRI